jgi:hypothetical protein
MSRLTELLEEALELAAGGVVITEELLDNCSPQECKAIFRWVMKSITLHNGSREVPLPDGIRVSPYFEANGFVDAGDDIEFKFSSDSESSIAFPVFRGPAWDS